MKTKLTFLVLAIVVATMSTMALDRRKISPFEHGKTYYYAQDWAQATKCFEAALKDNPKDYYSKAYLASIKHNEGDADGALVMLGDAMKMMEADGDKADKTFVAWCWSEGSAMCLDKNEKEKALDYISKACELAPADAHYAAERAKLLYVLKDYEKAREVANAALALGPEEAEREQLQNVVDLVETRLNPTGVATEEVVEEHVVTEADEATLPEFPGGMALMKSYIAQNTVYPKKQLKKKLAGNVLVEVKFDKEGNRKEVKINAGMGKDFDAEALRVVNSMPQFKPATYKGEPIEGEMIITVKFKPE